MDLAVWRDISLVWLIFFAFLSILPFGVLFFFAVKGMHRLRQLAKLYLPIAQDKARVVAQATERAGTKLAAPVIALSARAAQWDGIRRATFRRN
jgi:hypothetical protein